MTATDPRFDAWLSQETGIDASALGINALERAVLERVRATQAHDPAASSAGDPVETYWHLLNASSEERLALIEMLVVPETWFFRDREAFVALARLANEKLVREPGHVLRVLSAPCSSGEEPYSAAMALLDAGIGAERFTVNALDISARAIQLAQTAVYGRNSFRGGEFEFRERHFSPAPGGWRLNERVQQTVRFAQANLFEPSQHPGAPYDFIFCRNVLIYFHREAQDRAIKLFDAQLADSGTIFVGPAETGLMMRHTMSSARIPLAFAFQRTPPEAPARQTAAPFASTAATATPAVAAANSAHSARDAHGASKSAATHAPRVTAADAPPLAATPAMPPMPAARAKPPAPAHRAAPPPHANPKPHASPVSLADARRLADAGQFDEAQRTAHEFVILHGPDAGAFYLLGLISDARGRGTDARDYYRKALYLEPAHYEALTHLAALLDMTGDTAGAQQLMRRAQRAAAQTPKAVAEHLTQPRGVHGSRRR
jgi:chemotaxis protein methyltransferase WspC